VLRPRGAYCLGFTGVGVGCFVSSQNPLIGALLPRRADIVDDCEAKLVELQYLDVPVR
jgi:hypothetical protein